MKRPDLSRILAVGRWSTLVKMLVAFLAIGLVLGGVLVAVGTTRARARMRAEIRQQFAVIATGKMESVADLLIRQFDVLGHIALDETVIAGCETANAKHTVAYELTLGSLDNEWEMAPDDSELVLSVMDADLNPVTAQLLAYASRHPEYAQILVTDKLGALIAATSRPASYYLAYTPWWQAASNRDQGGIYVDFATDLSDSAAEPHLAFAIPIFSTDETRIELVGVVYLKLDVAPVIAALESTQLSFGLEALLVDRRGRVVAATDDTMVDQTLDPSWTEREYRRNRGAHAHEAVMPDGQRVLLGHTSFSYLTLRRGPVSDVMNDLDWVLYTYQPAQMAYTPVRRLMLFMWIWGLVAVVGAGLGGYAISRWLADPITHIVQFARQVRSGQVTTRAWVYPNHEVGVLADVMNMLLETRGQLQSELAERETNEEQERRRRQRDIELNAAVGDVISFAPDVSSLVSRIVELIRDHYTLYFVGVYLLDDTEQYAVLHAGTGDAGRALLDRGHRVRVGSGLVGTGLADGQLRVENNVEAMARRADADILPYARSEAIVPLRSRGTALGVLVVQSYQSDTFDEDLMMVLQVIADQVAVAIDSIRLYAESQEAAERLQRAYGELSRDAWREVLATGSGYGYEAVPTQVSPLPAADPGYWDAETRRAWLEDDVVVSVATEAPDVQAHHMALPIRSRGEVIGVLDVSKLMAQGAWTPLERDQLLGLAEQLGQALENARLYEVTQRTAMEEQVVGDITQRMRETLNVDAVLQTAISELQSLLGLETVEIRVEPDGPIPGAERSRSVTDD